MGIDFAAMDKNRNKDGAENALRRRLAGSRSGSFDADLSDLVGNPHNPRYADTVDKVALDELAESMASRQQQAAVVVEASVILAAYPDAETAEAVGTHRWVVIVGNRRLRAARLAGLPTLRVEVAPSLESVDDIEDAILQENLHREDLPWLLEAEMFKSRMDRKGWSSRDLAPTIHKSHTYINDRVALLNLIPEFKEQLRHGGLLFKPAVKLGRMEESEQRAVLEAGSPASKSSPAKSAKRIVFGAGQPPKEIATRMRAAMTREQIQSLVEYLTAE